MQIYDLETSNITAELKEEKIIDRWNNKINIKEQLIKNATK
jgi:hypothetical protein